MISAKFLWGNALLGGKLQIGAKNSNFEIFESALYMKSVSMPLRQIIWQCSLLAVDISRELTRLIFNYKTHIFGQKREKKACFSKCFLFINFQRTQGFDKKLYDRGVTSE